MDDASAAPYAGLTPDCVLDALDAVGLFCDGRLLALNSYENRVYQAWLDERARPPWIRRLRSSSSSIVRRGGAMSRSARSTHSSPNWPCARFRSSRRLHAAARPCIVSPSFRYAVYPQCGGRAPELEDRATLEWIGRFVGRIHGVGANAPFRVRPSLDVASFGDEPREWLLANGFIPPDLVAAWESVAAQAIERVRHCYERAGAVRNIRLHGDCHAGNVLWRTGGPMQGPHFVDFDDCRSGPAVQDLWMLLSGDRDDMRRQLRAVLAGYEDFCDFDDRELHLIEALRTLRLIHYSAWLARRWHDPAFPAAFPWFNTQRYWQDRVLELREQIAAMDEPPLSI